MKVEFTNEDGGRRISVETDHIAFVEEGPAMNPNLTYIVTTGNRGFGVQHSYDEVMQMISGTKKAAKAGYRGPL